MFIKTRNLITANKKNSNYLYAVTSKRHERIHH